MITFLAAMVFVFFDKTNLATKVALGAILGVLVFLIVILLYMEWENDAPSTGLGICWRDFVKYFKGFKKQGEEKQSGVNAPDDKSMSEKVVDEDSKSIASSGMQIHVVDESPIDESSSVFSGSGKKRRPSLWLTFSRKTGSRRGTMDSDQTLPVHQSPVIVSEPLNRM